MATYTPNLNLKKPSTGELYDMVADINDMKDKIDKSIGNVQEVNNAMAQAEIQTILDNAKRIRFKTGVYNVDLSVGGTGLKAKSNTIIDFDNGAILQAIATNLENYRILAIFDATNVTINNPQIVGERATHIGTTGEWGYGIQFENSKYITINNADIKDCWGDGIYIGTLNENIKLKNPTCDNNRRQGISVLSCKTLEIENPKLINTNGTSPQAGIDFEPEFATDVLENIRIVNPYTENNEGYGILFALGNMSNTGKIVDITVVNSKDKGSLCAVGFGSVAGVLRGAINIEQPLSIDSKQSAISVRNYSVNAPKITINDFMIINPMRNIVESTRDGSAVLFFRDVSDSSLNDIGNFHLIRPTIICDDANLKTGICVLDESARTVKNVSIIDPVEISNNVTAYKFYHNIETLNISDAFKQLTKSIIADKTIYAGDGYQEINNKGATGGVNLNLTDGLAIGWEMVIKIAAPFNIILNLPADEVLRPISSTVGKYFQCNTLGSKIKIKKVTATEWNVTEIIGIWNVLPA